MNLFLQQLANGIALGAAYAIFAMGFGLVLATMGILNVAHGTFATWGALGALYTVDHWNFPFPLAIAAGAVFAAGIGVVVDQVAFQPLRKRGGVLGYIITSIGAWIILINLAEVATDHQPQTFPAKVFKQRQFSFAGIELSSAQLLMIGIALATVCGLYVFLHRTAAGAAVRAVGFNAAAAQLSGVNARAVIIWTSALAAAIAGIAGVIVSLAFDNVSVGLGEGLLLKGFAAVVVGGFGDVRGTFLGGMIIGMSEVLGAQYISNSFRDAITFGLLLLFLIVRPSGIFGEVRFGAGR